MRKIARRIAGTAFALAFAAALGFGAQQALPPGAQAQAASSPPARGRIPISDALSAALAREAVAGRVCPAYASASNSRRASRQLRAGVPPALELFPHRHGVCRASAINPGHAGPLQGESGASATAPLRG